MSKLSEEISNLTANATMYYENELFNTDDAFFIIYDDNIAFRENPGFGGCCSYNGIYKFSAETVSLINEYCTSKNIAITDLKDRFLNEWGDPNSFDNDSYSSMLDKAKIENNRIAEFVKFLIVHKKDVASTIRAVDMLLNECVVNCWYMNFDGEYTNISDSVAEFGELITEEESDPEVINRWLNVIYDLDSYIFKEGTIL